MSERAVRRLRARAGVAVVGLGYSGPNLLRVLVDHPDADVRWICDANPEPSPLVEIKHDEPR
jgi:hypothetical protein